MKLPGAEDGLVCPAAELFRSAAVPIRWEEVLVRAVATLACSAEDLVLVPAVPVRSEEDLVRVVAALPCSAEDLVLVPVVLVRPAVNDVLPSAVPDRSG